MVKPGYGARFRLSHTVVERKAAHMNRIAVAVVGATTLVPMISAVLVAPATAATPTGTCTKSYSAYTESELAFDPAAQAIFTVIDANGNGIICFKYYPNGPHAGHAGNLVDDKAAPHE
jgi:hypothetical protein